MGERITETQEEYIANLRKSGLFFTTIAKRLGYSTSAVSHAYHRFELRARKKEDGEIPTFVEKLAMFYRKEGYTYQQDFPDEYLLMTNPETMKKVRLYYGSQRIWEYS